MRRIYGWFESLGIAAKLITVATAFGGITVFALNVDRLFDLLHKYTDVERPKNVEITDLRRYVYIDGSPRKVGEYQSLINTFSFVVKLERRRSETACDYNFFVPEEFMKTVIKATPFTIPAGTTNFQTKFDVWTWKPSPLARAPFRIVCEGSASNSVEAEIGDDPDENLNRDAINRIFRRSPENQ